MAQAERSLSESIEPSLIRAARTGDQDAFRRLTESYYRELHVHCYRMMGSIHDAEDILQETLLRAWKRIDTLEAASNPRAWLYKIATNACLTALRRRPARVPPHAFGPAADPAAPPGDPHPEILHLEPYPDSFLVELPQDAGDPLALYTLKESIELAFLTATQLLPARQRAVLILRDVLGWHASEVSTWLESSVASINSALQRARAAVADNAASPSSTGASRRALDANQRSVLDRYMQAWERADMDGLAVLLKEDALLTMPPVPTWFLGREQIIAFFKSFVFTDPNRSLRLVPVGANSQPACAAYSRDPKAGAYRAYGIMVLRLEGDMVAEITGFGDTSLYDFFGLPEELEADPAGSPPRTADPN